MNGEEKAQGAGGPSGTPLDTGSQALSEALRSSFGIVKLVMIGLVLVFLGSGIFVVGPQERAIVLRMGKALGEGEQALLRPGLHFSLPYPIDDHIKVSITGLQRITSTAGWYATTPAMEAAGTEPFAGATLNPAVDGYVITADENIIHARATLTYRISDPVRFVFGFVNASNAIQSALDDALIYAAVRHKVDDILTRDIIGFRETVLRRVTELAAVQNFGVTVEQCTVQSIPPRQPNVRQAFDDVLKAEVNRNKLLFDARSYENQVTNRAGAEAGSQINLAETERARMVNDVSSRTKQFLDLLPKYNENPQLFAQQRLMDTLGRALTNVQDKILVPESMNGNPRQLRYNIGRELPKPKASETK